MTVRVKICGLTEEAGVRACVDAGADWLGFVFFSRSPRYVTAERAAALCPGADGLRVAGLFVNPSDAEIERVLARVPLDVLQIYGSAARAAEIRRWSGLETWWSCGVEAATDLPAVCDVDRLVIEPRAPAGSDRPGGNGVVLPWCVVRDWRAPVPWLLAGGLRPETVGRAVAESGARAVDVSSGVESAPGVKDPAAVARFVREARQVSPG